LCEIEKLNHENLNLNQALETATLEEVNLHKKADSTSLILDGFTGFNEEFLRIDNILLKRNLLKTVLNKVLWDGEHDIIKIYFGSLSQF